MPLYRYAAFFRNVNLGRPGKPTRAQFIEAFESAGGKEVASFQAHGNAVFQASGAREAARITDAARAGLRKACGLEEAIQLRALRHLAALVREDPFAGAPRDDIYAQCVTFIPAMRRAWPEGPIIAPRREVEVLARAGGEVFSVIREVNGRPGNVNALLERLLGVPVTTRAWSTVQRLVRTHGGA